MWDFFAVSDLVAIVFHENSFHDNSCTCTRAFNMFRIGFTYRTRLACVKQVKRSYQVLGSGCDGTLVQSVILSRVLSVFLRRQGRMQVIIRLRFDS